MATMRFDELLLGQNFVADGGTELHRKISKEKAEIVFDKLGAQLNWAAHALVRSDKFVPEEALGREREIDANIEGVFERFHTLNEAMRAILFNLAKTHEEKCRELLSQVMRMIVALNQELAGLVETSQRCGLLEPIVDDRMMEIGDAELAAIMAARADPELLDKMSAMVLDAIDSTDFDADEHDVIFGPLTSAVMMAKNVDGKGILDGLEIAVGEEGVEILTWADNVCLNKMILQDGKEPVFEEFEQTKSTSPLLLAVGAGLVAAAVAIKAKQQKQKQEKVGAKA